MDIIKENNFPLAEVKWLDACVEEADIELKTAMLLKPLIRKNMGYCLINNEETVVLCYGVIENIFKGDSACSVTMAIPKSCIISIKELE